VEWINLAHVWDELKSSSTYTRRSERLVDRTFDFLREKVGVRAIEYPYHVS
jgi:hypothetical protein